MKRNHPDTRVDPVTLEVIQHALVAAVDEMEVTIMRTAYSPIVYEVRDFCAALLDLNGGIIAQARGGMPIFLSDLGTPVLDAVEKIGKETFSPGDAVLTNEPYVSGQHLNNTVVFTPIFLENEHLGYAAVRAHWVDVGGGVPSSFSTSSRDIYSEGLIIDAVPVRRRGEPVAEIERMLRANIRFPEESFGDMAAQIAACRIGENRFARLTAKYGRDTILAAIGRLWDRSDRQARSGVEEMPDGLYKATAQLDDDGAGSGPVTIAVAVQVAGDQMEVDFSGTSEQLAGNINCGASAATSAARVAFKSIFSPEAPANEGSFRALTVHVPKGSFLNAERPAAMTQWSASMPIVIDTVLRALSQADSSISTVPAGHHGSLSPYIWIGTGGAGGSFVHIDTLSGGWGASLGHDGGVGIKTLMHGDTYNVAIEVEEALFPLRVRQYSLRPDSGGPGKWRGGLGSVREYEVLEDISLTFAFERSTCPPWGLEGGLEGEGHRCEIERPDGTREKFNRGTMVQCPRGTIVRMISGSGGGFGDPQERDRADVQADLDAGWVTPVQAREVYGYVKDAK